MNKFASRHEYELKFASANSISCRHIKGKALPTFISFANIRSWSFVFYLNSFLEKFAHAVVAFVSFSITLESFSEFTLINVAHVILPIKVELGRQPLIRRSAQINFGQKERDELLRVISFFILHRRSTLNNGGGGGGSSVRKLNFIFPIFNRRVA